MLMTMNGNVKIDIANTTDGRLNSSEAPEMPSASNSGASRPPGSRIVPIPNVMYSAPNIGKTIKARTTSRYLTRRTRMYANGKPNTRSTIVASRASWIVTNRFGR